MSPRTSSTPTSPLGLAPLLALCTLLVAAFAVVARADPEPTRAYAALMPRQTQMTGTPLYLNEPSCDFFQCSVNVTHGGTLTANWLNAPPGDVQLDLMADHNARVAYPIAKVPGTSQPGYCNAGAGVGVVVAGTTCGGFSWTVPSSWAYGNYTLRAMSVGQPDIQSYTDVILIVPSNNSASASASFGFSTVAISGAPRSTTSSGTAAFTTLSTTAAVSPGAPAPSSSAAASSGASSASRGSAAVAATGSSSSNAAVAGSAAAASSAAGSAWFTLLVAVVGVLAMGGALL